MATDVTLILKIRGLLPSLNPALQKVAAYIIENPREIKFLRIKDLASKCEVSEATVVRFVKAIGLSKYQELKIILAELTIEKTDDKEYVYNDVTRGDSLENITNTILANINSTLKDTKKIISSEDIEKAISILEKSDKIDVYGAGGSLIAAEHFRIRLYRLGLRPFIYSDPSQQAVSASLLTENDVAIGISNSGMTISTISALKKAKEQNARTICITNHDMSPITRYSDIKLFTSTKDSAFFQQSMVSWAAQIFILDILYAGLAVNNISESVETLKKSALSLQGVRSSKP